VNRPNTRRLGDAYVYEWGSPDFIRIEIDQVHRTGDAWGSWIRVSTSAPEFIDSPHLFAGSHNLAAMQSRTSLAKHLATRHDGPDWIAALEMACVMTVEAEKIGEPFAAIGSLPEDTAPAFTLEPVVRRNQPTSMFGDGGVLKSTTAMFMAALVRGGIEACGFRPHITGPVLWLDYETDIGDLDDTYKRIRGGLRADLPDLFYRRESLPLYQAARQVRRFIDEEAIVLVVIDSVGAACGDDPERAEPVLRFFSAVRSLGVASILADHVRKENANGRAFGSAYKHNASRLTFEMRRAQMPDSDLVHVGVYPRKANKGRRQSPFGLAVAYTPDAITFKREDVAADPELAEGLSLPVRIIATLKRGPRLTSQLAEECGTTDANVRAACARMKAKVSAHAIAGEQEKTWFLLSNREEGQ